LLAESEEFGARSSEGLEFFVPCSQDEAYTAQAQRGGDVFARLSKVLRFITPAMAIGYASPEAVVVSATSLFGSMLAEVLNRLASPDSSTSRSPCWSESEASYDSFRNILVALLLDEPIEDGVTHPAEAVINETLRANSSRCLDWLSRVLVEVYPFRPRLSASVLRCIGRT
jgi:hypothetical protein